MRGHKRLRTFLQERRSGADLADAANAAEMSLREAELHDQVEQVGGYGDIVVSLTVRGSNGAAAADMLRVFIERVEKLNEEKKGLQEDIKGIFQEAKGAGFDATAMRSVIKLREMDADARAEADSLIELYREALGVD